MSTKLVVPFSLLCLSVSLNADAMVTGTLDALAGSQTCSQSSPGPNVNLTCDVHDLTSQEPATASANLQGSASFGFLSFIGNVAAMGASAADAFGMAEFDGLLLVTSPTPSDTLDAHFIIGEDENRPNLAFANIVITGGSSTDALSLPIFCTQPCRTDFDFTYTPGSPFTFKTQFDFFLTALDMGSQSALGSIDFEGFSDSQGNQVAYSLVSVPEPAFIFPIACALVLLARVRRKR